MSPETDDIDISDATLAAARAVADVAWKKRLEHWLTCANCAWNGAEEFGVVHGRRLTCAANKTAGDEHVAAMTPVIEILDAQAEQRAKERDEKAKAARSEREKASP